jgi:hypothetical protein
VRRSVGRCGQSGGDGFESGMHAEGAKETAEVVLDCLGAQVELGGDLLGRAVLLQKTEHLDLTGSEMRLWRRGPVVGAFLDQSEDAPSCELMASIEDLLAARRHRPTSPRRGSPR